MLSSLFILFYSLGMTLISPVAQFLGFFWPKLHAQMQGRFLSPVTLSTLARARSEKTYGSLFFCSSAGEFEQAKPLIERMQRRGDIFVHVCFFSRSGTDFVAARQETVSYSLCPLDSVWSWGRLFSAVRPDRTFVIRHELWPAFLTTARYWGRLYLVDASCSVGESASWLKRRARLHLLRAFHRIFVVSEADLKFFKTSYKLADQCLQLSGDTKYDRVRERAIDKMAEISKLSALLEQFNPGKRRLIVGSAHMPDVHVTLAAWRQLQAQGFASNWLLVIVPHVVSPEMLAAMSSQIQDAGLKVKRYSQLQFADATLSTTPECVDVLLVDVMGFLAEFYGTCDLAFVGGAMQHQVHNVLEPACHGLTLAFGPFYKNSREAEHLVEAGAACIIHNSQEFANWWLKQASSLQSEKKSKHKTLDIVTRLCGASDRIIESIYDR